MGFISEQVKAVPAPDARALWDRTFGVTKEDPRPQQRTPTQKILAGSDTSYKRLLQAMRSNAPGGWSDDRYEQSRHFVGLAYVAIHRICTRMQQAEFQVFRKDPHHQDGKRPVCEKDPREGDRWAKPWDLVTLLEKPNRQDSFGKMMYRWCFPAGTKIRMADGSQKNIEQIRLLDEVLTAEGNIGKVNQCHVRDCEEGLAVVKLWGYSHLKLTPEHPVMTKRGYVPAGELSIDDWVAIPRYKPQESRILQTASHIAGEVKAINGRNRSKVGQFVPSTGGTPWPGGYKKVPDFLELTPGLGRIFGLFLAEGHTAKQRRVHWTFNVTEMDTLVAELVRLLKSELGLTAAIRLMNKRKTAVVVSVWGKLWQRLFESLCGKWSHAKRIHPDLLCGPDDFLNGIFTGWMDGDGCEQKNKSIGTTVSHELALNLFDIANFLGLTPIVWQDASKKDKDGINHRRSWKVATDRNPREGEDRGDMYEKVMELRSKGLGSSKISRIVKVHRQVIEGWFRGSRPNKCVLEKDRLWRRVRSVQLEPYLGKVYNFGVSGDNSYVAEAIGVHNCQQKYLTGSALTWVVPNELGDPVELYPIPTAIAIPQPTMNPQYPNGFYRLQPIYPYGPFSSWPTPSSAVGAAIPAEWMLKFQYPHPLLRYDGYSPLTALRLHLDEIESIDRSRWYSMKRTINPSAVLNLEGMEGAEPLPETEIERIKAEFEISHQGSENVGQLFIAAPGAKLEPWGGKPIDMEYQSGWDQLTAFAMGGLGITKPAAGMIEDSSYSTLFATLKQLNLVTLDPECQDISSELTRGLAHYFGDDLIVEIRCPRIDDHDLKAGKLNQLIQGMAITKGELRRELEMPLWGDERDDEIAGQPSQPQGQPGMEQGGMPGQEGMPPQEQEQDANGQYPDDATDGAGEEEAGLQAEPPEITRTRETPGRLGLGALGPRKSLNGKHKGNGAARR